MEEKSEISHFCLIWLESCQLQRDRAAIDIIHIYIFFFDKQNLHEKFESIILTLLLGSWEATDSFRHSNEVASVFTHNYED